MPNRRQDNVARALLTGLIFQKGVPLTFRNDEATELVEGTVAAMNSYLRIQQITTGGHNPRSNAVVERFMQHLTACLTKCDDSQYGNMRDYLPAIFSPQHSFQLVHQLHAFRGWARTTSQDDHGSTCQPY